MKRIISLFILSVLIFVSCDTSVNNVRSGTQSTIKNNKTPSKLGSGLSVAERDSVRKQAFKQFKVQNGQQWKINWDKKIKGAPITVFGGTTEPIKGNAEQAARAFLKQNRSLFNMKKDLSDLILIETQVSSNGIQDVRFQQMYGKVPIFKGDYQVHIRPDGRIDMANGHYYSEIKLSTTPGITAASAKRTALADLNQSKYLEEKINTMLIIYPKAQDRTFALAWKITIPLGKRIPGTWRYIIDAQSGEVLNKLNLDPSITGDGDIIEKTPYLTPYPATKNFYRLGGSGNLRGTFVNVHNLDKSRAYSSVNSFQYTQSNTHFDEANVYYHLDTFRSGYVSNLGFNSNIGSDQDIEAYVHEKNEPNNAHYSPSHEAVYYGENLATTDVVIYHEYIHAVSDVENGSHYLDPNPTEEGAINEGLADYFPGSYVGRSEHGGRDMASPTYSDYSNIPKDLQTGEVNLEEHTGGEFFSAILWDLLHKSAISQTDADGDAFNAIHRLSGEPSFLEFRNAMLSADNYAHGGTNYDLIQNTFADWGVSNPVPPPPPPAPPTPDNFVITNPQSVGAHPQLDWDDNPRLRYRLL